MPFTLAHPVAALPLRRLLGRGGVASALVIGSMVPDAPYFMEVFGESRGFAHHPFWLLGFNLPVGLALWLLYEALLKRPLAALGPQALQRAVSSEPFRWRTAPWLGAALSVLVGAATHIAWDAFTHEGSLLLDTLPVLRSPLFAVGGDPLHLYRFLQHASTVLGLSLLFVWSWRGMRRLQRQSAGEPRWPARNQVAVILSLLLTAAAGALFEALRAQDVPFAMLQLRRAVGLAAVGSIQAFLMGLLAWALFWNLAERRRSSDRAGGREPRADHDARGEGA